MKHLKKNVIFFGAIAVALVMLSSVTAVPNVESELIMEEYEEQKSIFIEQLESLWLDLLQDENLHLAEWQENSDVNPCQDFEDLFDVDGFLELITSDDFIDLLKEDIDDLLCDEGVLYVFNTDEMQAYVYSEEFLDFVNTDEMQYILEKLHEDDDSVEEVVENVGLGAQQSTPLVLEGGMGNDPVNCPIENGGVGLEVETLDEWYPGLLIEALIVFLIGLVLWVPAVIVWIFIGAPIMFLYEWGQYMTFVFFVVPGSVVLSAMVALFLTLAATIVICGFFPFLWLISYFSEPPPL